MKTIYKYPLYFEGQTSCTIQLPLGSKVLTIKKQNEVPVLYAEVETEAQKRDYTFYMYCTGQEIPGDQKYITTLFYHEGAFVLHFFH